MIRKIVGAITLSVFNLFIGCGSIFEPNISSVEFKLDSRLSVDDNGYHHMVIDTSRWQTTHRISGNVFRDDNPVNIIKFVWASSHYWVIGDEFGYVIANNGLTDDMTYVGYDTTYITWFTGWEVPIVNGASYSNSDGEVNTMMAPIKTMVGDTAAIQYSFYDDWRGEETNGVFYVIFD